MPNDELIKELQDQIAELTKKVGLLEKHQHLGSVVDGSMEFLGETEFKGKSLLLAGGITKGSRLYLPLVMTDGIDQKWLKPGGGQRLIAGGLAVVGEKGTPSEQVNNMMAASKPGKAFSSDPSIPSNQIDWEDSAQGFIRYILVPQGTAALVGPSVFGPFSFFSAERSPNVQGSIGTITQGGSTLTDSTANFTPQALVGCLMNILNSAGTAIESYIILDNTANVLTLGTFKSNGAAELASFFSPTGSYSYQIRTTVFLGEAGMPWSRLYVGEDIRLGYGTSSGSQTRYIKWGTGSPEGVVTANIGSIYLRFDGSTSTTLYVKTANNGSPVGWTAK